MRMGSKDIAVVKNGDITSKCSGRCITNGNRHKNGAISEGRRHRGKAVAGVAALEVAKI